MLVYIGFGGLRDFCGFSFVVAMLWSCFPCIDCWILHLILLVCGAELVVDSDVGWSCLLSLILIIWICVVIV